MAEKNSPRNKENKEKLLINWLNFARKLFDVSCFRTFWQKWNNNNQTLHRYFYAFLNASELLWKFRLIFLGILESRDMFENCLYISENVWVLFKFCWKMLKCIKNEYLFCINNVDLWLQYNFNVFTLVFLICFMCYDFLSK